MRKVKHLKRLFNEFNVSDPVIKTNKFDHLIGWTILSEDEAKQAKEKLIEISFDTVVENESSVVGWFNDFTIMLSKIIGTDDYELVID